MSNSLPTRYTSNWRAVFVIHIGEFQKPVVRGVTTRTSNNHKLTLWWRHNFNFVPIERHQNISMVRLHLAGLAGSARYSEQSRFPSLIVQCRVGPQKA